MLYHKWSSRVFTPLHSQIAMTMSGRQYQVLEAEKRKLFNNYLSYSHRKVLTCTTHWLNDKLCLSLCRVCFWRQSAVMTITHSSSQRTTLSSQSAPPTSLTLVIRLYVLQAVTGRLNDPLLAQQTDRATEQHIISGCSTENCGSAERGLDAVHWLAIQLVYVDSSVRKRSQ